MRPVLAALALASLAACTAQQATTANRIVAEGQAYCAVARASGPLVVALANESGVPVSVIGKTSAEVSRGCAVIDGIPVIPPPNPANAPIVAAKVTV